MTALSGCKAEEFADLFVPDTGMLTSSVRITVKDNEVTGRAFLKAGGYDDEVYEKAGPGQWRVKSSTHVAATAH